MKTNDQKADETWSRFANDLGYRPFSCMFGFVLVMSVVGGITYVAVFSDSSEELWSHAWQSALIVIMCCCGFVYFMKAEAETPLPLVLRRLVWWFILFSYVAVTALLFLCTTVQVAAIVPTLAHLAAVYPIARIAIRLLRNEKVEQIVPNNVG